MNAADQLKAAMRRLERLDNAIGSNRLSGVEVTTEGGKAAIMAIATSAARADFNPDAIRKNLIAKLRA